jgi:chorismate mutase
MESPVDTAQSLEEIRREIDEIDAGLLDLLQRRFQASERVLHAKGAAGETAGTPLRPAREAALMRKLIAGCRAPLPRDLVINLWRAIISSSTQLQADATMNVSNEVYGDGRSRDILRGYFGTMPVLAHNSDLAAVQAVGKDPAAIAVLQPGGDWPHVLTEDDFQALSVTGVLPFIAENPDPELLIVTQAPSEPTGQDETLILSSGQLPRDFVPAPLWRTKVARGAWLTSLPGFLSTAEMPLVSLTHNNDALALHVLGRYPSPLTI